MCVVARYGGLCVLLGIGCGSRTELHSTPLNGTETSSVAEAIHLKDSTVRLARDGQGRGLLINYLADSPEPTLSGVLYDPGRGWGPSLDIAASAESSYPEVLRAASGRNAMWILYRHQTSPQEQEVFARGLINGLWQPGIWLSSSSVMENAAVDGSISAAEDGSVFAVWTAHRSGRGKVVDEMRSARVTAQNEVAMESYLVRPGPCWIVTAYVDAYWHAAWEDSGVIERLRCGASGPCERHELSYPEGLTVESLALSGSVLSALFRSSTGSRILSDYAEPFQLLRDTVLPRLQGVLGEGEETLVGSPSGERWVAHAGYGGRCGSSLLVAGGSNQQAPGLFSVHEGQSVYASALALGESGQAAVVWTESIPGQSNCGVPHQLYWMTRELGRWSTPRLLHESEKLVRNMMVALKDDRRALVEYNDHETTLPMGGNYVNTTATWVDFP